ncbi:MAG: 4Fe-4S dicluster domain-containing protein [Desulfurococcaceae archaeon]
MTTPIATSERKSSVKTVRIYFMNKAYDVPIGLTIMKALEYAGYKLMRGVGCRGGFCGACAVAYRKPGDYKFKTGLACQTVVENNMYIALLPYSPLIKPRYNIFEMKPEAGYVLKIFPEVARCISCNSCSKACPQGLEVMDAVQSVLRNDILKAADLVFDCISCGLCSLRCPAEIRHIYLFQLLRRLAGRYLLPRAKHLEIRVNEIESGKYFAEIEDLMKKPIDELKKLYSERDIEPE